jgi:glycosyltransferase involved in cell wall biosynthesis
MAKKADIKKLLNKRLTGKEAGKLVIQDNWLVDNGEKGFLSERDLSAIKSGLLQIQDINDYNSYIETYKLIDYTLKEAQIMALTVQKRLYAMNEWLYWYFTGNSAIGYKLTPTIMTKKEYEDKRAQRKALFLEEITPLETLILEGYIAGATEMTVSDEIPEGAILSHWHSKNHTPEWQKELSELINLIKADKLKPVFITGSQRVKLDEARSAHSQQVEKEPLDFEKIDDGEQDIFEPRQQREDIDKLLKALYKSGKSSYNEKKKEELLAFLERAKEGSSSEEELDEWLGYTFLSGEDLYNSGAEHYKNFIDELQPDTGGVFGEIAILITEGDGMIDERGYYRSIPFRRYHGSDTTAETISEGFKSVKETMRTLLGIQSVLEAVSELIGVDFATGIDEWIDEAKALIREINKARLHFFSSAENKEMAGIIKPINLSRLKPSAGIVKLFRERMATGLGQEWWNESLKAVATDALQRAYEDGELSKASKEYMAKRGYSIDKDGTLWQE